MIADYRPSCRARELSMVSSELSAHDCRLQAQLSRSRIEYGVPGTLGRRLHWTASHVTRFATRVCPICGAGRMILIEELPLRPPGVGPGKGTSNGMRAVLDTS
jgi:hypothetical protein